MVNFANSRGYSGDPDCIELLAGKGLLLLDEESEIDLEMRFTGPSITEREMVATLYTDVDFDIETMSFPEIPQENIERLAQLIGRPNEKPEWYPCLL